MYFHYTKRPVTDLGPIIIKMIDFLLGFAALIAVLFIIYAGILYVTSSGNQDRVKNAKNALTYSIIGLVVIILSYFLVQLIINMVSKL
jgi:amino acid transporter